jgi:hypothetical protein
VFLSPGPSALNSFAARLPAHPVAVLISNSLLWRNVLRFTVPRTRVLGLDRIFPLHILAMILAREIDAATNY